MDCGAEERPPGLLAADGPAALSANWPGTKVIVKGQSGTLLATTTLRKDAKATSKLALPASFSGAEGQLGVYEFSTSVPTGNGPYTVGLVGVSSIVVSAKQLNHLQLTCG
jgi:hypothetical protein